MGPQVTDFSTERPATARPRIMLVDDDHDFRATVADILTDAGYDVVVAASGGEALERLKAPRGRPDLLILDLAMPGVSGWDVLRELRSQRRPAPRVLVLSEMDHCATAIPGVLWTRKVVSPDAILLVVRRALER